MNPTNESNQVLIQTLLSQVKARDDINKEISKEAINLKVKLFKNEKTNKIYKRIIMALLILLMISSSVSLHLLL